LLGLLLTLIVIGLGARDAGQTPFREPSPPAVGSRRFDCDCGRDRGGPASAPARQPFAPNQASPEIPLSLSSDRHEPTRWGGDARAFLDAMARADRTRSSIGIADNAETPISADDGSEHDP
jgi:hypothetical protein